MLECDIAIQILVILKIHRLYAIEPDLDVRSLGPDAVRVPLARLEGAARLLVIVALERHQPAAAALVVEAARPRPLRSEERRVGKEGRSRRARSQLTRAERD